MIGRANTASLIFSLLTNITRVMYNDPTVNAQLTSTMDIVNACARMDLETSTSSVRDSARMVTVPFSVS